MSIKSRITLPLFLIALQFFAPLLHAHAGQQSPHFGLHIPGLEFYDSQPNGVVGDQIQLSVANSADCIVVLDQGIREDQPKPADQNSADNYLLFLGLVYDLSAPSFINQEFLHPPIPASRISLHTLSPRAPPY